MTVRLRGIDRGERAALVISECQSAIVDPAIAMFPGLAEQVAARETLARIAALADACRAARLPVIHCTVRLSAEIDGFPVVSPLQAIMRRNPLLRADRPESAVHPALSIAPHDIVCDRDRGITAFEGSRLDTLLRDLGVETIILTGVSTDIALPGMAIGAVDRGFAVVVPEDCTAGGSAASHDHAVRRLLPVLATVTDAGAVLAHLKLRTP